MEEEKTELVSMERSEGGVDAVVNGTLTPVFQEDTWNEEEEVVTGLVYSLGGPHRAAGQLWPFAFWAPCFPRELGILCFKMSFFLPGIVVWRREPKIENVHVCFGPFF